MSGSSAVNYVAETPSASDEDRYLDQAAQKTVDGADYTLLLVALALPNEKDKLMELAAQVRLLASRERAARFEAKLKNNDAIRQRVAVGVYERKVETLEDEIDKANRKIARLKSNLNRANHALSESRVRIQELAAKAKKGGAC